MLSKRLVERGRDVRHDRRDQQRGAGDDGDDLHRLLLAQFALRNLGHGTQPPLFISCTHYSTSERIRKGKILTLLKKAKMLDIPKRLRI